MKKFKIMSVDPHSIGTELELQAGDQLISINEHEINDILDYRYLIADEMLLVEVKKQNGEIWELEIEKEYEEDLGLHFEEDQMEIKTCKNNCIFCFIDQLPEGLRKSLYIKDDDERLSFLTGNYITLTNLSDNDYQRIIDYHIMPINISIHTTNSELRCKMLNNRFAGQVLEFLDRFKENNIMMNGQIVLVPSYNDNLELSRTLDDLMNYYPTLQSVSVVPVGLSKHRRGLKALQPFSQEEAKRTIEIINNVHNKMLEKYGRGFVYPADEFFKMADVPIPDVKYYDDFLQIENGVGMIADFKHDFCDKLEEEDTFHNVGKKIGILTSQVAHDEIKELISRFNIKYKGAEIVTIPIINYFFGEMITVSGLITGQDIINQIKPLLKIHKFDELLIPENAFKKDSDLLLDDYTLEKVSRLLEVNITKTPVNGRVLVEALLNQKKSQTS
ncbi:DUF512 domain-containing protein [Eubacteriaceae bacterium ES3]|nr:DUF512 domain-containing protein [Eubacteriaceae bacterium ES3]